MSQIQPLRPQHSMAGDNAMTEIALALAMGFFAIMILTLVSMGAGTPSETQKSDVDAQNKKFIAAALAPSPKNSEEASAETSIQNKDRLIIYYNEAFMDETMTPIFIDDLDFGPTQRVILALDPMLPMSEALKIRSQFTTENLIISALDDRWLSRLSTQQ